MNKALPIIRESPEYLKHLLQQETHRSKRKRLQALYLLASGQACWQTEVAALLDVDRSTVRRWLTIYDQGGLPALLDVYVPAGRPAPLSPSQIAQLEQALHRPGFFASYEDVRRWIEQTFGVALTYNAVHKLVRYKLNTELNVAQPVHPKKR